MSIFFAKSLWIHYLPRINYGFIIFFAKSLWIHYLGCEIILNSLLRMQIHRFFANSPSFTFFHYYDFTIFFANRLCIYFHFRWITIFVANRLWIYYLYEIPSSFSRMYFKFTIYFAIFLWIHYLFHEMTIN